VTVSVPYVLQSSRREREGVSNRLLESLGGLTHRTLLSLTSFLRAGSGDKVKNRPEVFSDGLE